MAKWMIVPGSLEVGRQTTVTGNSAQHQLVPFRPVVQTLPAGKKIPGIVVPGKRDGHRARVLINGPTSWTPGLGAP